MGVAIEGRYELPAPRQMVWDTMLQPEVLRDSIPGCSELETPDGTRYHATITTKIGPIKATFRGLVVLSALDEPNSVMLSGAGEGGLAGFAKGDARITLSDGEEPGTSVLRYEGDVIIGGKIAQLGSRLVASVVQKLSDQFFQNLAQRFESEASGDSQYYRGQP